jgi:transposase-like protein
VRCFWRYAGCMRYAQGGGLTAEGRRRREQVRLEAARRFEQGAPAAAIAAELRVSERSVRRWRHTWQAAGEAGLASRGRPRSAGWMSGSWPRWTWR